MAADSLAFGNITVVREMGCIKCMAPGKRGRVHVFISVLSSVTVIRVTIGINISCTDRCQLIQRLVLVRSPGTGEHCTKLSMEHIAFPCFPQNLQLIILQIYNRQTLSYLSIHVTFLPFLHFPFVGALL